MIYRHLQNIKSPVVVVTAPVIDSPEPPKLYCVEVQCIGHRDLHPRTYTGGARPGLSCLCGFGFCGLVFRV